MWVMRKTEKQLICEDLFSGQRVLVVGLGKTGLSCVKFLAERNVDFAVMDSREQPPGMYEMKSGYPAIDVHTGSFDKSLVNEFDVLIVSPGIALKEPALQLAKQSGKQLMGDIEILAKCTTKPVVAITGSNGKSTVTTLLGEMVRQAKLTVVVAGNIGLPVLDLINDDSRTDLYVLELSSFQLETTHSLDAVASTILNISEDHMDRYDSMSEYAAAKRKIVSGTGTIIVNLDDSQARTLVDDEVKLRTTLCFTLNEPKAENEFGVRLIKSEPWLCKGKSELIPVSAIKLKGQHNIANILAALALGSAIDLPMPAMLEAARQFSGLPHRTQWVTEHKGVQWFNDSKATNVGAAIAAIQGIDSDGLILILGGQGKGQDFSELRAVIEQHAKLIILLGEDAKIISDALGRSVKTKTVNSLENAVAEANSQAVAGDIVLLSPACASFDMFDGYEHRGNEFMRLVKEVTHE